MKSKRKYKYNKRYREGLIKAISPLIYSPNEDDFELGYAYLQSLHKWDAIPVIYKIRMDDKVQVGSNVWYRLGALRASFKGSYR